VDTHTAGEPTRIAIEGVPTLRGSTLLKQREHFKNNFDRLRQALLWEPRGHRDMFGAILTRPSNGADLAAFFMDAGGYVDMCIHGSIGVLTAALELGLLRARGAKAWYKLETPAGIIPMAATFRNGKVEEITVRNVPSFVWSANTPLKLPGHGTIQIDVVYSGNWFALVSAAQLGIDLDKTPLGAVLDIGRRVLIQARRQIVIDSSLAPPPHQIALVEIHADVKKPHRGKHHRNIVVFGNGQYDRSPCGTGTCARMAGLHAKGELAINERFLSQSVTGSVFKGRLRSQVTIGSRVAVIPEVTGSAWITGFTQAMLDPRDLLGRGFLAAVD
jgi:proline racemase